MKGSELLEKMELIEPAYVEAADTVAGKKKNAWLRWGAAAACLCIAAAGILWITMSRQGTPQPPAPTGLEPITIPKLNLPGAGYEASLSYDISELANGNPWSENMGISSLPVFINKAYDPSGAGLPIGLKEEEMTELLNHAAAALDCEIFSAETITGGSMETQDGLAADKAPVQIHAETSKGTLDVRADGSINYCLADGYGPSFPDDTADAGAQSKAENVLSDLIDYYKDFLGFQDPKAITLGEYDIYGDFYRSYAAYDASGDDIEDILNYNFRQAEFILDFEGNFTSIRKDDQLLAAEKTGDYPIIDTDEAVKRLAAGNYQTSVPYEFPGKDHIAKTELVYRTGPLEEVLLPYYRFYVLISQDNSDAAAIGLKNFGIYYVPAISEKYIANMPVYDGAPDE